MVVALSIGAALAATNATTHVLDNGLTVIVEELPSDFVNLTVQVEVGTRDQAANETELAHLVEHLTFERRTLHDPDPAFSMWEVEGGAWTADDVTAYNYTVPVSAFDLSVFHISERFVFPGDDLRDVPEILAGEKGAVAAERFGMSTLHDRYVDHAVDSLVYPPGHRQHPAHPYDQAGLADHTVDAVLGFRDAYTVPANTTLVVVGGVPEDAVLAAVHRWFDPWPAAEATPKHHTAVPTAGRGTVARTVPELDEAVVVTAWALPPPSHADAMALRLAARLLRGSADWTAVGGVLTLRDGLRAPAATLVDLHTRRVADFTPSPGVLSLWQNVWTSIWTTGLDGLESRANALAECHRWHGDANCTADRIAAVQALTADEVAAAAARWLTPERRTSAVLSPEPGAVDDLPAAPFEPGEPRSRTRRAPLPADPGRVPPPPPALALAALPGATSLDLGPGRTGWFVHRDGHAVDVVLALHRGAPGAVGAMTAAFATDPDDDTAIAAWIDASRVVLHAEGEGLATVGDLARRLRRPTIPKHARADDDPTWWLEEAWRGVAPPDTPAKKRVKALLDDTHVSVVVVGDLDARDVELVLGPGLGRLGGGTPRTGPEPLAGPAETRTLCIDADTPWANVSVLTGAPGRGEPDAAVMDAIDWTMGGQFHSRLKTDLRLGRQLSYYQGSDTSPWQRVWRFQVELRPRDVAEGLALLTGHLDAAARDGLTAHELERAWIGLGLRWNLAIERGGLSVHGQWLWGTPTPPVRVSPDDAARVAAQWLGGPRLFVIEGPRAALPDLPEDCWSAR